MTLRDVLRKANLWSPEGGWETETVLVGRALLASDAGNYWRQRLEKGELYLNPGRDETSASQATEAVVTSLRGLIADAGPSEESEEDRARARFIIECLDRPMGKGWVQTRAEIAKIRNLPDHIEVFVADPHRHWPVEDTDKWPDEWNLHRMERYVRWTPGRSRSPGLGDTYRWPGPCSGGSWPVFYRPFLGCICCTNGMVLAVFGKGFWTCWPPRVAIAVRRDGGQEEIEVANLPKRLEPVWSVKPPPRDVLAGDMSSKLAHLVSQEHSETRAARTLAELLRHGRQAPLRAIAGMVQTSIIENWTLRDQLQAEEVAGDALQQMLGLPAKD